jgi:protein-tyrosine phosphatase
MPEQPCSRHIKFEAVLNFRDLGGYRTKQGRRVAWRRLYRSGEMHLMTGNDLTRLKEEVSLASILDLRNDLETKKQGVEPVNELGVRYFNVSLATGAPDINRENRIIRGYSNMGEVYLFFVSHKEYGRRMVKALEIVAEADNYPLVFHCSAGKDRTGVLAALILSVLGVADDDIIQDYTLTAPFMRQLFDRYYGVPNKLKSIYENDLPGFFWESAPESMDLFLSTIKRSYGSIRGYLEAHGAEKSLFDQLENALLD